MGSNTPLQRIVDKYCRHDPRGRTVMCKSSHAEDVQRAERGLAPLRPKVIYDSVTEAQACAVELLAALGGEPQRAYLCHRSRTGHAHLSVDISRRGKGKPRKHVVPTD